MSTFGNSAPYIMVMRIGFFAFWDKSGKKETLVLATHGILKKTNKTPKG